MPLRLLGGLGIRLHATGGMHPALARSYADIDLVCSRKAGRDTSRFLVSAGYEANERFNAMNGSERMIFYDRPNRRHVDLFVGGFRMCHALPLADRLDRDSPRRCPRPSCCSTKLQVVQLNAKDAQRHHRRCCSTTTWPSTTTTPSTRAYVARAAGGRLGTLAHQPRLARAHARDRSRRASLSAEEQARVQDRAERLWERVEREPKGLRWRSRARIGDSKRWYDEPDEIGHQH